MPDSVMLFAAGLGTRMAPLTDRMPKPLIAVGGLPLIDHALRQIEAAGLSRVVVNLHYMPEMIRDHLALRSNIVFSQERTLLETGGGLKAALPLMTDGAVYTMNTDAVWSGGNPLTELAEAWDPSRMDALLLLVHFDHAIGHRGQGDFGLGPDERLRRGGPYVYTGVQIINPSCVRRIGETIFSLNRVWDEVLGAGRLFGTLHSGGFCDVGRPEGIALAESHMQDSGHV
jgi:N-acetyl-alpha-D-muramate 1-phosphate uridylyltransferase